MRNTYGIAIPTFNGAYRVDVLLECLERCPSISKMSKKIVVEDKMPELDFRSHKNHCELEEAVMKRPGWELVSLDKWSNMQGTSEACMQYCCTDFVWMISDDIACVGDPFKLPMYYLENTDPEITDKIGGAAVPIYNSIPDLRRAGIFESADHINIHEEFYHSPFNGWLKDMKPVHFDLLYSIVPTVSAQFNGAAFILRRSAWQKVGGFNLNWDVLDQYMSYQIYFKTDYLIVLLQADPFYHAGACAQNSGWEQLSAMSSYHHSEERCIELFGQGILDTEKKVRGITMERASQWQDRIRDDFFKISSNGTYAWRFV
jgi:hypothetical protein